MKVLNEVKNILSDLTTNTDIDLTDHLQNDLGLDSIRMVTLLILIEDSFAIVLDETDMNPFDLVTVSDIVILIEKYIGGNNNETCEKA